MKKIEAIIRPEYFQRLREEIETFGIKGLTVSEVGGCGVQKGKQGIFRGNTFEITLLPKVKVELVIDEEKVEALVEIIKKCCTTGEAGDGKIFISTIEQAIRIRTGESGLSAIV
ncbi:P-II family nitrogen regulator [Halalkalibacter alkaliphilus]|uniref:P-II family nitrogen regulator n=1 Tax=Halalkalibacter alkaliphilus TaxID=2917993 RepID=A0A9X2I6B7_9BACI|nr:P-II family nitrogen regulator [Halalkalibacter alkaliphilus]MCL7748523.1 P-II family nitrogen regulator [Halalkalibacter alkaliphilus]